MFSEKKDHKKSRMTSCPCNVTVIISYYQIQSGKPYIKCWSCVSVWRSQTTDANSTPSHQSQISQLLKAWLSEWTLLDVALANITTQQRPKSPSRVLCSVQYHILNTEARSRASQVLCRKPSFQTRLVSDSDEHQMLESMTPRCVGVDIMAE